MVNELGCYDNEYCKPSCGVAYISSGSALFAGATFIGLYDLYSYPVKTHQPQNKNDYKFLTA